MNETKQKKSAKLYRARQHQLRLHAKQLRALKRMCALALCVDMILSASYFLWRGPILAIFT